MCAIANHAGHFAACRRHHTITDHQQTMLFTGDIALDNHATAFINGHRVRGFDFLLGDQIQNDPTAMIAILGFDHYG